MKGMQWGLCSTIPASPGCSLGSSASEEAEEGVGLLLVEGVAAGAGSRKTEDGGGEMEVVVVVTGVPGTR